MEMQNGEFEVQARSRESGGSWGKGTPDVHGWEALEPQIGQIGRIPRMGDGKRRLQSAKRKVQSAKGGVVPFHWGVLL